MTDAPDATALAAAIANRDLSPREAIERAIERAERINPELNAIVVDTFDRAADQAGEASAARTGALHGVPLVMKDLDGPIEGDPAPNGNHILRHLNTRHTHTGAVGRRLQSAGAISLGRGHSPEFGSGNCPAASETDAFGATRNPWNSALTPMGSSGGSAAAVAAGIVPIAHATDGGGSIRMPASACGVIGLKPGRGRVSSAPAPAGWAGGATQGGLARTMRDAALLLDVLAGPEPEDGLSAPLPVTTYVAELDRESAPLRCGVLTSVPYATTDPECASAVAETATLLDELGHRVDIDAHPVELESLDYLYSYITVIRASGAALMASTEHLIGRPWTADDVEDGTWVNYQRGLSVSAPDYVNALERLHGFTRRVLSWWNDYDILVTPTLATPPPRLGYLVEGDDRQRRRRLGVTMPFTAQFNVTGQPAMSLPLHWTPDGVPIGVQLISAPFREDVLIRLGAQLEQARPWSHRYSEGWASSLIR